MGNLLLCTGEVATTPYYLNFMCMNVYSIEELCYLFALNPFMITQDIMDNTLVNWIEDECKLPDLAGELRGLTGKGEKLGEFVNIIINYANYCTEEEKASIEDTLSRNAGLNDYERRLSQADFLLKNARMEAAIEEYGSVLTEIPPNERNLRAGIFERIGYAYATLFMFDIASKYYKRAYDISGSEKSGMRYLASLRMYYPEDKYIAFIGEHTELSALSEGLESMMSKAVGQFEGSNENLRLNALSIYKDEGNTASYNEEIDGIIRDMKEAYIKMVTD